MSDVPIDWGALVHQLLALYGARSEESNWPLNGAALNLHPKDMCRLARDWQPDWPMDTSPPTLYGIALYEAELAPEGCVLVVHHNLVVASISLDDGVIRDVVHWHGDGHDGLMRGISQ